MLTIRETCIFVGSFSWSIAICSNFAEWSKFALALLGSFCLIYLYVNNQENEE